MLQNGKQLGIIASVIACLVAAGCLSRSSSEAAKYPVSGSVQWKGEPLEVGTIFFVPKTATGNGTTLDIAGGEFVSSGVAQQLIPGEYRIEITSAKKTGKVIPGPGPNGQVEEIIQVISTRYNANSTLTAQVSDTAENRYQFKLTNN
ncbi:hypothetical protein M4951_02360 [Blastopirellula sp. J2-11]|uniref:hypothetical protein n=1 Tax=Blastopirellula sp. J2-11 TaxID=2943192 RepID=UPI0021C7485F|nr:hypothetical protein [Blastopirellula sp. J2-11]UUO07164.1 hypothetical protein M4951_02360 [Blastopirellula sp. J2-11]